MPENSASIVGNPERLVPLRRHPQAAGARQHALAVAFAASTSPTVLHGPAVKVGRHPPAMMSAAAVRFRRLHGPTD